MRPMRCPWKEDCRARAWETYISVWPSFPDTSKTYFSFTPPPTPAPLPDTVSVASSKVHDAAADTAELKDRNETTALLKTLIVSEN